MRRKLLLPGETLDAATFGEVVELGAQRPRELLDEPDGADLGGGLPLPLCAGRQVLEDLEVLLDLLDDAGPAHLDHDLCAVLQRRGVCLPD